MTAPETSHSTLEVSLAGEAVGLVTIDTKTGAAMLNVVAADLLGLPSHDSSVTLDDLGSGTAPELGDALRAVLADPDPEPHGLFVTSAASSLRLQVTPPAPLRTVSIARCADPAALVEQARTAGEIVGTEGLLLFDESDRPVHANRAFARILGRPLQTERLAALVDEIRDEPDEIRRPRLRDAAEDWVAIHPDDIENVITAIQAAKGEPGTAAVVQFRVPSGNHWKWIEARIVHPASGSMLPGMAWAVRDIHEQKTMALELEHRATHDRLTNLPDRARIRSIIAASLERDALNGTTTAVLFCDLDDFKTINDSLGHALGDEVIVAVAQRLSAILRATDTVGRFGGDEFVMVLTDLDAVADAEAAAQRILDEVIGVVSITGHDVVVSLSIGVATGDTDTTPDDLLSRADIAMYAAKQSGKARYEVYHPSMGLEVDARLQIQNELGQALERDQVILHYQPIYGAATRNRELIGAEGLVRWEHPRLGLLGPDRFVGYAEESGQIIRLGRHVIERATIDLGRWTQPPPAYVSVNLSTRELQEPDLAAVVLDTLSRHDIDPTQVAIEITETALADVSGNIVDNLAALRLNGVVVMLDDFGTGYSGLNYLRRFPVDGLKIDASYVNPEVDTNLIRLMVSIARTLELFTVAEGVETERQLETISGLGVNYAQGFYLDRPGPPPRRDDAA